MSRPNLRIEVEEGSPERYLNRESSWLQFNARVLDEARNPANPLIERLKFLAIFESNLDEFYMVRVSGLIEQFESGLSDRSPDGMTAEDQLRMIAHTALPLRQLASRVLHDDVMPALESEGINIRAYEDLTPAEKEAIDNRFHKDIFPVCTPLILSPAPNIPFISNRSLNLAVILKDSVQGNRLARVKIPSVVPRFVQVSTRKLTFVMLEDVIEHNLHHLFPGVEVGGSFGFRVLRDADVEIRELEAADLVTKVEETLRKRRLGDPVLLQVAADMPAHIRKTLMRLLVLDQDDVFDLDGMLGMEALWELAKVDKPNLKYKPFVPYQSENLSKSASIFDAVAREDVLVAHPFDSFRSVEEFVRSGATDESVIGIKQTLYRVGTHSPVVESLLAAAEEGKQVAAMVELKARFDESNNLEWAKQLERAGVHVTYGFAELKTHAKLCLVVRREPSGIRSYAHIGTGNYNPETARIYTDLGLFTCDPEITLDIAELFNFLTGFAKQHKFRKLLVAPVNLREGIIDRIEREIEHHENGRPARLLFKLNSLVDPEVIDALYDASQAGVQIDLIVRGICCLRPLVGGLSENIRVTSIVGRFLEHSRAFYFENGGSPEVFIGSADLMRRNLDRRVEALVPLAHPQHIRLVRQEMFEVALKDNVNAWHLAPDGTYHRVKPSVDKPFSAHEHWMKNAWTKMIFG